ncbi:phosphatase PAP2 family protein [Longirhabdus pacifica]|uniref:phosphatase PAP2 family protein n=1 Tax=Longirhabdus pacifica TaxID=2305227 RepID=UPI001008B0D9|nr:phosphatase PAP2 family protein [Longirhabdus pacifica]
MHRVVHVLQHYEIRLFQFINQKRHAILDLLMHTITYLGGALFTITLCLGFVILGNEPLRYIGLAALLALTISHIPVAIIKKKLPRLRPYLVLPKTNTCKDPLTDHSFPSGHTTAAFSIFSTFMIYYPLLTFFLLPLSMMVGISRIYLGLHYPSDVVVGSMIGYSAALLSVSIFS